MLATGKAFTETPPGHHPQPDMGEGLLEEIAKDVGFAYRLWEPLSPLVVVGAGSDAEAEVHLGHCRLDGVGLARRRGGGSAVVLSPGTLCIALVRRGRERPIPQCFEFANGFILRGLERLGVRGLSPMGVSDLCIGDRKVLGCSLYRGRHGVLYQGSLLINPDLSLIERYLKHPPREPAYRRGRPHADFLTTLARQGYLFSPSQVARTLDEVLGDHLLTVA